MRYGNDQKWSYVQEIDFSPRRGIVQAMVVMLDLVSPHLRQLSLHSSEVLDGNVDDDHSDSDQEDEPWLYYETLQFNLLGAGIDFPILSHLRLHEGGTRHVGFLALLFNSAPCLLHCDITLSYLGESDGLPADSRHKYPSFQRQMLIKELRLGIGLLDVADTSSVLEVLRDLLLHTPEVQHLYLYSDRSVMSKFNSLMKIAGKYQHLRDLSWESRLADLSSLRLSSDRFAGLRRLLLKQVCWHDIVRVPLI